MFKFILVLVMLSLTIPAIAGQEIMTWDQPPQYQLTEREQILLNCQRQGIREAWGAQARFKGAPMLIKFVDLGVLHEWFVHESAPNDAIYIADMLSLDQQGAHIIAAFAGWKRMDAILTAWPNAEKPDWVQLPIAFYHICIDEINASNPFNYGNSK